MIKKGWNQYEADNGKEITCRICGDKLSPNQLTVDAVDIFGGRAWDPCGCGNSGVMVKRDEPCLYLFKEIGGL